MIQDILPFRFHNEYKEELPDSKSLVLFIKDNKILMKRYANSVELPVYGELDKSSKNTKLTYLFAIDNYKFYSPVSYDEHATECLIKKDYSYCTIDDFRVFRPRFLRFAIITASHILNWYRSNAHCGVCGEIMQPDHVERKLVCSCGREDYPKISPAVIVGIINGEKMLLTKYASDDIDNKKYALVAGFAEIGETIEETVIREVMEETGIKVKNLKYYKSQPWAQSRTLLFGFYCELDGSDEIVIDKNELGLAKWVDREDIPVDEHKVSLTSEMMTRFKNEGSKVLV